MEKQEKEKGITLSDIFNAIKKSWILLLVIVCAVTLIGAVYTFGITKKKYYAEGSVSVEYKADDDKVDTTNSLRYVNTIGDFLTSETVLTNVSKNETLVKYDLTVTSLRSMIKASYSTDAMLISFKVTTTNADESMLIVKGLVDEIVRYSSDSTDETLDAKEKFFCRITKRDYGENSYNAGPNRKLYMVVAVLAGVVLGLVVVFVKEFASNKFKSKEEIEALGYPIIGVKADQGEVSNDEDLVKPSQRNFEPYNRVLSNVKLANVDNPFKVITITSTTGGELKTTVSSNLAYTASNNNKKAVLLDLDLRKPRIHRVFKVEKEHGIVEYLEDSCDLEKIIKKTESGVDVITAGKSIDNPVVVLESQKLKDLINTLKEQYDYVFIDTPPLLACSDASTIASISDGVIYNVALNQAHKKDIRDSLSSLVKQNDNIIGVNITKVKMTKKESYYYYQYGYGNTENTLKTE